MNTLHQIKEHSASIFECLRPCSGFKIASQPSEQSQDQVPNQPELAEPTQTRNLILNTSNYFFNNQFHKHRSLNINKQIDSLLTPKPASRFQSASPTDQPDECDLSTGHAQSLPKHKKSQSEI